MGALNIPTVLKGTLLYLYPLLSYGINQLTIRVSRQYLHLVGLNKTIKREFV